LLVAVVAVSATCLGAGSATAAPGDLDPTFSDDGRQTYDLGAEFASFSALGVSADGNLLGAGKAGTLDRCDKFFCYGEEHRVVASISQPGDLDPAFGTGGVAALSGVYLDYSATRSVLAVAPSGEIVTLSSEGRLAALAADGSLLWSQTDGPQFEPQDGLLLDDGTILICGASDSRGYVQAFHPDGTPDEAFASGSTLVLPQLVNGVSDLLQRPDGDIVVLGTLKAQNKPALWQIGPTGAFDSTFSEDGFATLNPPEHDSFVSWPKGTVTADGSVVLGSASWAHDDSALLAKVLSDGSLDTAFGDDGFALVPGGAPDGLIPGRGAFTLYASDNAVVAVDQDGSLDTAFGRGGVTRIPNFRALAALAVPGAHRIALGGFSADLYSAYGYNERPVIAMLTLDDGPADLDADGVRDRHDECPDVHGRRPGGCPLVGEDLSLQHAGSRLYADLHVPLESNKNCVVDRKVSLVRRYRGKKIKTVFTAKYDLWGAWVRVGRRPPAPGRYVAKASRVTVPDTGTCRRVASDVVVIRDR